MLTHTPVLLKETLDLLSPQPGDRVFDVTLGLGGHSETILRRIGPTGSLVALDADAENIARSEERLSVFRDQCTIIHTNFVHLPDCLSEDQRQFDIILADLGLSSPHIDDPERGFTFRQDVPIDMRFDRSEGMTVAMLLASLDTGRLVTIFRDFGELPAARRFVDLIVGRRKNDPVRTSGDLSKVASQVYGYKALGYLPQIFQALRIAVNREVEALKRFLEIAPGLLMPGGRLAVISYHSLEDGLVKSSFRTLCASKKDPVTGSVFEGSAFGLLTKRPIRPDEEETKMNPRSRSARLRAISKRRL